MRSWDCEFFRKDADLSKAEMMQQYAADQGPGFVGFTSGWEQKRSPSGAKDAAAPQVAPFYWGIKDVQYQDAARSPTWRKSMLKKVQQSFVLPPFMEKSNEMSFKTTPEFWFAVGGGGAKAHMDTHIQSTVTVQIAGTKRWRMAPMEARRAPYLAMIYKDGAVYKAGEWMPLFSVTLHPGDAMFFPPGIVHETLTVSDDCASSVTFQFNSPWAARYYRRFFPRVRRTADIHEAWLQIEEWATLMRSKTDKSLWRGLPYAEAKALAPELFRKAAGHNKGSLQQEEVVNKFGRSDALGILGWHDLDEDGVITLAEFEEAFAFWAGVTYTVIEETPKKWRKLQLRDMRTDFNIEDLPPNQEKKIMRWSQEAERKISNPEL